MKSPIEARNVAEVTEVLLTVFNGLNNKTLEPKEVVELNNTAGKIASFLKVQLAYHQARGERPEIEFLNAPPTTKTIEQTPEKKDGKPALRDASSSS